jgi:hypothetical protein
MNETIEIPLQPTNGSVTTTTTTEDGETLVVTYSVTPAEGNGGPSN